MLRWFQISTPFASHDTIRIFVTHWHFGCITMLITWGSSFIQKVINFLVALGWAFNPFFWQEPKKLWLPNLRTICSWMLQLKRYSCVALVNYIKKLPIQLKSLEYRTVGFGVRPPKLSMRIFNLRMFRRANVFWNVGCISIKLEAGCSNTFHVPKAAPIRSSTIHLPTITLWSCTFLLSLRPKGFVKVRSVDPRDLGWGNLTHER